MAERVQVQDWCWAVWFRNAGDPKGKWYCWEGTAAGSRSESIQKALRGGFGLLADRKHWNRQRRAGLVACRVTILSAHCEAPR